MTALQILLKARKVACATVIGWLAFVDFAFASPPPDQPKYTLTISDDRKIENPTDHDVLQAVDWLSTAKDDNYIILGTDDLTYVQCEGNENSGYVLEYQDASVDKHFQATSDVKKEALKSIFVMYLHADPGWNKSISWKRVKV